jgi:hypothetical protein
MTLALAIVVPCSVWVFAEKREAVRGMSLVPHRAYAVTVYLDSGGSWKEGPWGQTTELREPNYGN